ncbi:MAG: EAL domain-containing protein [Burkholderiales bacterium]|nr:MAG: EAL domain-containing protein [Burkholderiales bacterium]
MRPASIVVVEDERIVALDLSQRLQEMGYRVMRTVARGEDALHAVDALRPDLVLMDINIEGALDGIEAACRIRETSRTPVVFMTAYAEDETLARAQSSRPYGYLIKPYESRELHATIQVALARHDADAAVERSEERLRLAMDVAGLVVWDWDPRTDRGTLAQPGAVPGDLSTLLAGFAAADRASIRTTLLRGQPVTGVWPVAGPVDGPDAGGRWMELHAKPLAGTRLGELRGSVESGTATRVVGVLRDVTGRRHAEERLRQAGVVYERIADAIVMADSRRRIVSVNPAFVALTGWTEAEVLGRDTDALLHEPPHPDGFWEALGKEPDGLWRGEVGLRRRDGRVLVALQTASRVPEAEDDEVRYVLTCSDLTSMRRAQEELSYLAHHDVLTGLPNRALLDERLDHELQRARRLGHGVALMFIDLDGFKTINDSLGHAAGDRLLQEVGRRLRASIRDADTAARLGGDEFVVVMTDLAQPEDASRLADKLLSLLAEPVDVGGRKVKGSASIGVAVFPQDGGDRGSLMMAADSAMYAAKASGRNHVSFYTRALARRARRRLDVEQGLRRSLERGELALHFQPIVALSDNSLVAAEALLRWEREDGVSVAPQQFVPVAEDSGLIETIGVFVLERICEHARAWTEAGLMPPRLCMNVSPRQLERGDFAGRLHRMLDASGLSPDRLEIEVTETALRSGAASLRQLDTIRALGVRIAIDDFGTGYSSLSALKHLPLDRLKIDRSFVQDLPHDTGAVAIVETIVAMSRTLGLCVTAEGIETDAQLAALRRIGCEDGQGFLLGRPLDAVTFAERLRASAGGPTRPVRPLRG